MNTIITLQEPIKRGDIEIKEIVLRRPNAGALRGCSLRALLDTEMDHIARVLPRISEPPLIPADIEKMDPADLLEIGGAISNFLLPRRVIAAVMGELASQTT